MEILAKDGWTPCHGAAGAGVWVGRAPFGCLKGTPKRGTPWICFVGSLKLEPRMTLSQNRGGAPSLQGGGLFLLFPSRQPAFPFFGWWFASFGPISIELGQWCSMSHSEGDVYLACYRTGPSLYWTIPLECLACPHDPCTLGTSHFLSRSTRQATAQRRASYGRA